MEKQAMCTMDVLAFLLLHRMSKDDEFCVALRECLKLPSKPVLGVCWATHKYHVSVTGSEIDRMGSGGRTDFFLVMVPESYAGEALKARERVHSGVRLTRWSGRQR